MNKIQSFQVDHTKIEPGIYISRVDGDITTFDMRFVKPNTKAVLTNEELHSFEHMFATVIRNSEIGNSVIYFGPMGCQTGFYLLTRNIPAQTVLVSVKDALQDICDYQGAVFGASEIECGNYKTLCLESAKKISGQYLTVLKQKENTFQY